MCRVFLQQELRDELCNINIQPKSDLLINFVAFLFCPLYTYSYGHILFSLGEYENTVDSLEAYSNARKVLAGIS